MPDFNAIHEVYADYGSSEIVEPVSLDEAKAYMRVEGFQDVDDSSPVEFDDEDDLIEDIITASREAVEKFTGLHLVSKTLTVHFTNLKGGRELPGPMGDVVGLYTVDDTEITDYTLVGTEFKRLLCPKYENMKIVYEAGSETIDMGLKNAILIEVLWRYENRGDKEGLCLMAKRAANPYKRVTWLG
jgi:hypothetical protein